MITAARRREPDYPLPESPTVYPTLPTPYGFVGSTHASVIDLGRPWNGYRWWMANTPYPNEAGENPCIYGSNDRITWQVPHGLTNPIYPWSGINGEYNSDTEIAWDDNRGRLVCYWREYKPGAVGGSSFLAASTADGATWTHHGTRLKHSGVSPAIVKDPAGGWRMYTFTEGTLFLAADLLGPWTLAPTQPTNPVNPSTPLGGWHGDVIYHDGLWMALSAQVTSEPTPPLAASIDGYTWHSGTSENVGPLGYRPTLEVSTVAGYVDVWTSRDTTYYRMPISDWAALIP